MDVAERRTAQTYCRCHIGQSALHKDYVCCVNRDIGSRTDRDTDVRSGQCRGIIDTVADHCHSFVFLLEASDHALLAIRKHARDNLIHAGFLADGSGGALIVSGQHDNMDSHVLKLLDRLRAVLLHHIRNCNDSGKHTILREEQRCLSCLCKLLRLLLQRRIALGLCEDKLQIASGKPLAIPYGGQSVARKCLKFGHLIHHKPVFLRLAKDRLGKRMFALLLQCIGKLHELLSAPAFRRKDIGHSRLSRCDRTGLVQCNRLHLACLLQGNSGLKQDTVLGTLAVADHDRNRRCKSERARAADDQHGDSSRKRKPKGLPCEQPADDRHSCDRDDRRHEHAGNGIRDLCNRRFGCRRVTYHPDDLG